VDKFNKVTLFIVGCPKAGTTSLCDMLGQHDGIFMCQPKEPRYFCKDFHSESDAHDGDQSNFYTTRTEQDYSNLFVKASDDKLLAEGTTTYLFSKVAAREIYNYNPRAKIVILIREPSDFLQSYHSEMLATSKECESDFLSAIELEKFRKTGDKIPRYVKRPSYLHYSEQIKFAEQIKRYLKYFSKEQIRIYLYDDFKYDNLAVYRDILSFCGLDTTFTPITKKRNPRVTVRYSIIKNYIENGAIPKFFIKIISSRSENIYRSLRGRLYSRFFVPVEGKSNLSPGDIRSIKEDSYYEVQELQKLVEKDILRLWGYDQG